MRVLLIELVWRLVRWQPDYPPVRKLVEGAARAAPARTKTAHVHSTPRNTIRETTTS